MNPVRLVSAFFLVLVGSMWTHVTVEGKTVFLERGQRGIVPCSAVLSQELSPRSLNGAYVYWYFSSMQPQSLLISIFRGIVGPQNGIPEGIYDIDRNFSLVIENVTDSNAGTFFCRIKPKGEAQQTSNISVAVKVHPREPFPQIIDCDGSISGKSAECEVYIPYDVTSSNLTCEVRNAKPAVDIQWFRLFLGIKQRVGATQSVKPIIFPPDSQEAGWFQINNTYTTSATIPVYARDGDARYQCEAYGSALGDKSGSHMIANIVIQSPPSPRPGTITSSTEKVMASTTDVPYMPSGGLIAALVVGLVVVLALVIVRSLLILNKVLKRRADNGRQRDPERIPLKDNVTMQTCKDKLKAVYMARMQRISTGLAEENQAEARHTDDIFTDLELQDTNNTVTIESHEQMIGLLGGQNNRFVLKGAAGCGKTTLVRRFGYDWGNNSEYMGRFDFVFVLKMKEMKKNYGLLSAILTQNFTKDQQVSKDDLLSSIRSSASNVLIILDGLDEVNWEVFNSPAPPRDISVKDILTVNALPESYVIVTTRPHMMHKLNKLSKDPVYNVIEATGFSQQKRNEYIERWFRFDKDKTKKLIHEIETSAFLEILAKTPIMLKLLCYIRKHQGEDKDLPARITELYQRVIDVLLKHQVRKHNSSLDAKRLKKVFTALGKVAFEGLMDSKDGTLVFARNKFPKRSLVDGLKLGLFLEEPDSHDHTVTFVHKTVQEYFAAFYVVQKTDLFIQQKLLSKVTIDTVQEVEYILLFSCGMNTKAARLIFQHISGIQDNLISDAFLWVQRFTLMLYYESQSDSLKAGVGSWLSLRYKEEFTAFQHYIENVTQSASHEVQLQRLDIYLHFVKDYSLIHNILQRVDVVKLYIGVLLSNKLREKLEQLDETISRLTVKPGETILCIDQREQGRCDEAASAELQDQGMTAIAALVPFCKTKGHGFGLRIECDIIRSQQAFSDIASSLAESRGVYFSVLSNRVSGYMKSLEPLIPFLKYLEFYDCGLSEVDLKSLAQLLPNAKMLCELHISGGSFSVQAASFLLEALAKHVRCPKMVLELGESELTSNESIETVMREIFSKVETVQGNVKNQFYLHK